MNLRPVVRNLLDGNGRHRPKASVYVTALVIVGLVVLIASQALASSDFPDVDTGHPYYSAINDLASRGIIGGYTTGYFGPEDPVIRQQFAKMIVKTLDLEVTGSEVCPFTDVAAQAGTDPFYPSKYVAVCAREGITNGKTATTFDPYSNITRAQVMTMVVRAAQKFGIELSQPTSAYYGDSSYTMRYFTDATHGLNAQIAEVSGLLWGIRLDSPGVWDPWKNATRGEVAQILWRLGQKQEPVTTTTSSTTTTTAFGGGNGAIAYVSFRDGNAEIYVMGENDASPTRLTNNPEIDDWPDWSPDGTRIAFTRYTGGKPDIYVMNADGTTQVNLTVNAATDSGPDWSPDGTRIAFHSNRAGGTLQIYLMNADGTGLLQLTSTPQLNSSPDWSPDGNRIAFESDRDGQREIYVMNADGTAPTRLTFSGNNYGPQWSPSGDRIAFSSSNGIWSIRPDGTGLTQLTINAGPLIFDVHPTWSPDGTWIAFDSRRSGNQDLYVIRPDGTGMQRITTNGSADSNPSWN
jgi:TolB protein